MCAQACLCMHSRVHTCMCTCMHMCVCVNACTSAWSTWQRSRLASHSPESDPLRREKGKKKKGNDAHSVDGTKRDHWTAMRVPYHLTSCAPMSVCLRACVHTCMEPSALWSPSRYTSGRRSLPSSTHRPQYMCLSRYCFAHMHARARTHACTHARIRKRTSTHARTRHAQHCSISGAPAAAPNLPGRNPK